MKRLICIVAAIMIVFSFSGCSGIEGEAKNAFEGMMDAFKSCDKNQINKYYSFDNLTAYLEETEGEQLSNAVLQTLEQIEYKVESAEKINDGAVKLNVELTTIDFSIVVQNFIDKVDNLVKSSEYLANIEQIDGKQYDAMMVDLMIEAIDEGKDTKTTKTVEVLMTTDGEKWTLGGDSESFFGELFENLSESVENFA